MSRTNITPTPIKVYLNTNNNRPNEPVKIKQGTLDSAYLEIYINDKGGTMEFPTGMQQAEMLTTCKQVLDAPLEIIEEESKDEPEHN
jgi:hypothetical protein